MILETRQSVSHLTLVLLLGSGAAYAQTATIGGSVYTGAHDGVGPVMAPAAAELHGAQVMVQNQHSGGAFITYGTVTGNQWEATVPAPGDYVVMFSAPDHDCTSREFTVVDWDALAKDAYLPPLYTSLDGTHSADRLPLANLLVYTFYDNAVNGEDDAPDDPPLNGVTVHAWDQDGNLLATGVTGTQPAIDLPGGRTVTDTSGLFYFTGLPPGEVSVTSDPSTAYLYDVDGPIPLPAMNPISRAPLDFDETTEFYLLSSEEGGRAFEVVLFPGDPGTEEGGFLVWHGFVRAMGQITAANVADADRFPFGPGLAEAGTITGTLADADQGWVLELVDPGEVPEEPEALVPPLHPGVSANTLVPDGLVILHTDGETIPGHPVATVEPDPVTGEFVFHNVPPGRYRMFCSDIFINYVYVQQEVTVMPGQDVVVPNPLFIVETPGIMVPRFFARAQGFVTDNTTGEPIPGAEVRVRLRDGSVWRTQDTDATGWYNFDALPEVEVIAYVDVALPAGHRGAIITDTFHPDAVWLDPNCNPTIDTGPSCVDPGIPYEVAHNAMNRYVQWYTANYQADFFLEPIPGATGDIGGFVFNDHLTTGTWVGNGVYDEGDDRTIEGVTVELWDAAGATLLATTTTGAFDDAAALAQGWKQPYTMPPDEWGGVFVGPMPGFYEFRDLSPGDYTVKVIPPLGFSPSPAGTDVVVLTVAGGARNDIDFGINTLVPLSAEIEGGVFDDLFIDPRPLSLMWMEKAGIDGAPVGVYDHLGYFLGAGFQGNPMCYDGANQGTDLFAECPVAEPLGQKPELERRFAPATLLYLGNDPSLPGYRNEYLPLMMSYTMGQGKHKFEADWSLVPVAFGQGPTNLALPPTPLPAAPLPPIPAPVINDVQPVGSYLIIGENFGPVRGFSTATLSGRELYVTSWSDTEIHVEDPTDPISGPMIVTTHGGPSNAVHVEIAYDSDRALYMAERSVFVNADSTGAGDGSWSSPFATIGEAMDNLPAATPRYVFVEPGYYNERVHIQESDIQIIGAGPQETTVDGLGSMQLSFESQGYVGMGPVFFIGEGGEFGGVENIVISGLTVTGGSVDDEIGCGIFGDAGNRNLDINTCIIDHNGGYYGGAIWLQKTNHDVAIWSNTISNNGCPGGYSGGISVNDEPEYGPHHGEPEHVIDDSIPGCPPGTYEIFNNHIFRNFSPDYGGGIALYEVKDHLIVAGNLLEENHADDHGGAVFFEDCGPVDLYGNIIRRNSNYDDGGAISFEDVGDDNALVRVYNNLIAENWADDHGENHVRGGGLAFDDTFLAEVFNNTIVGNIVAGSKDPVGGGIDSERNGHEYNGSESLGRDYAPGFSDVKIYNNIIWGNLRLKYDQRPHSDEEDLDWTFGANHVWTSDNFHVDDPAAQSEAESHLNSEAFSYVEFNCIDNGEYADRFGNVSVDPQFVDPDNLDWHLAPGSPVSHLGAYADGGGLPEPVGTISPLAVPEAMCLVMDACLSIEEVTIGTSESTWDGIELLEVASMSGDEQVVGLYVPQDHDDDEDDDDESHDDENDGMLGDETVLQDGVNAPFTLDASGSEPIEIGDVFGAYTVTNVVKSYADGNEAMANGIDVRGTFDAIFPIDLATEEVTLTIDDGSGHAVSCSIPIGSFELDGDPEQQEFKFEGIVDGMDVTAEFEGCDFKIEVGNVDNIDQLIGTTMTIDLWAGLGAGFETIVMEDEGNVLIYKREMEEDYCGGIVQPIAFTHAEHMEEDEANLTCQSCHGDPATQEFTGLPGKDVCLACHDESQAGSDYHEVDELAPYIDSDLEIPWVNVPGLRTDVFFSHDIHEIGSQTDCLSCHAGQAARSRPRWRAYKVMRMGECRDCHEDYDARNDCQACHEPGAAR